MAKRSLLAEFFYNETKYREGSGSKIIVSEIDRLFQQGKTSMSIDSLAAAVEKRYPLLKEELKSVEGWVRKVFSWAKSKGLVEVEDDEAIILLG